MSDRPLISAIVTTFNRDAYLPRVLRALAAQTLYPDQFEVVIIDDGSWDNTHPIVNGFTDRFRVRYAFQNNSGLAAAKNHGVFLAQAPIVLFLHDDHVADPRLLEEHLIAHRAYPGPHHAVLGHTDLAPEIADDPLMDFLTGTGDYLLSYEHLTEGEELDYQHFWRGRTSCKRDFLLLNGVFDPIFRFGCEDIELGYRLSDLGLTVVYHPKARSHIIRGVKLENFIERIRLRGAAQYVLSQKHLKPEILRYSKVLNSETEWRRIQPLAESVFQSTLTLHNFVIMLRRQGLTANEHVIQTLRSAYHRAFNVANCQGIVGKLREHLGTL
ncbi:glycosyltransferase family 2 protein [Methylolobus aquaticus]